MSALFRSLNNFSSKRENVVKEALINTLNENAREIEFEVKQKGLGKSPIHIHLIHSHDSSKKFLQMCSAYVNKRVLCAPH